MCLGLALSGALAPLPGAVRFLVAAAGMVWIPGICVADRLLGTNGRWRLLRLPLGLGMGLSLASLVVWPLAALGAPQRAVVGVITWAAAAGLAVFWWRGRPDATARARWVPSVAVLGFVLLGLFAALQPSHFSVDGDAFDHIGYVRRILATNDPFPSGVLARPADATTPAPADPRKGTVHSVLAGLCRLADVEPYDAWAYLPLLLFPAAVLAFLGFCREFVDSRWQVAAAGALFLVSYGGIGYRMVGTVGYGQNLSVMWYWILVPVCFAYIARPRRRTLVAAGLLVAGGAWVHVGVVLHALVLAATLVVFQRWGGWGRRAWTPALVLAGAAGVAGAWKVIAAWGTPNAIHTHLQGVLWITRSWFVVSPWEVLRQHGMLFLGGLVLFPVAAALARASTGARRAAAFAVLPLVFCFVPPVTVPLVKAGSYMVSRVLLNVPSIAMVVVVIAGLSTWARRGGFGRRVGVAVALILWAEVFAVPTVRAVARDLGRAPVQSESPIDVDLARFVRQLPAGTVVLADPRTSYWLTAVADHPVVAVTGQHGNPNDPYAFERLRDVRDVLSPYTISLRTVAACERWGVGVVVCNGRMRGDAKGFLAVWDPAFYRESCAKLAGVAGHFRAVYQKKGITVFLYDPEGTGETLWSPESTPFDVHCGADRETCVVPAPQDAFQIVGVDVQPAQVIPGETARIRIDYTKARPTPFGFPYSVYLRLDHESLAGRRYPGEKLVRRWRERWRGERLRLTVRHRPFEGRADADTWPLGIRFCETVPVHIPSTMRLGRYRLQVSVERDTRLPNFTLSDLLYNRDRISGKVCAEVQVVRQRVGP